MDPRKLPAETGKDAILRFTLDFENNRTKVECSKNIQSINILSKREKLQEILDQHASCSSGMCDSKMFQPVVQTKPIKAKRDVKASLSPALDGESDANEVQGDHDDDDKNGCKDVSISLDSTINEKGEKYFNTR